jgi:hypothetical protein
MKLESAQSAIRVTLANAMSDALVTGIDNVEQVTERPLTQVQQSALWAMTLMAYRDAVCEAEDLLKVDEDLERFRARLRPVPGPEGEPA